MIDTPPNRDSINPHQLPLPADAVFLCFAKVELPQTSELLKGNKVQANRSLKAEGLTRLHLPKNKDSQNRP